MADVPGKFFSATKVRTGVSPSSPGSLVGEPLPPVNPPGTSLNSVGLTMPSAFTVSNSPLTSNGTIGVAGAGTTAQYIRGDGSLADFPESSGGGSSVSYYLNGSVNQGTIGGVAYKELNKVPILGAGTDFSISANGYIASFLTDAGDPNLLEIPGGNWNFETYFSASSSGGTPSFYVDLYKYDGSTFTLIASSSSTPEFIAFGTITTPYFSSLAVPTTVLALTDRLAVRYYVTHSGRTITLHTENNHLCQIITTFTTGITALNGLTAQVQNFAVGTSGTDFAIASATATHTFNLPTASATNRGALSSADWSMFNAKQDALTLTTTGSSGAATLVGATLNIPNYGSALSGYVPYTGATSNVALGIYSLSLSNLTVNNIQANNDGLNDIGSLSGNKFRNVYASSFVKTGGTSSEYLKADGSVSTLTNPVTGTGTTNYLPKFTGTSTIGNSLFTEDGTNGAFGGANYYAGTDVRTFNISAPLYPGIGFFANNVTTGTIFSYSVTGNLILNADPSNVFGDTRIILATDNVDRFAIFNDGNVTIANSPINESFKLYVSGTGKFSSNLTANSFIKIGGTSSQFLKADGSVDSTTYVPTSRTITINGTTQDLSADRTYNVGTVTSVTATAGTGISISGSPITSSGTLTITNTAPDQVVSLTASTGISISGTYPNFTITNTSPASASGITGTGTSGKIPIFTGTNTIGNSKIDASGSVIYNENPTAGQFAWQFNGSTTTGQSYGANVVAGTNSSDIGFKVMNAAASVNYFVVRGDGNVGIGTASPATAGGTYTGLDIRGTNGGSLVMGTTSTLMSYIYVDSTAYTLQTTGSIPIVFVPGGNERMRITSAGEVLIGNTDNGAYNLQCNGTGVWGQGAYVNGSDRNIKDNIATIEKGLEYIQKMNPVKFRYKPNYTRDHSMQTGFIAQELQEVFASEDYLNGLVQKGVHLSVAYQNLLPILVKAIQELKQEIDTLKN